MKIRNSSILCLIFAALLLSCSEDETGKKKIFQKAILNIGDAKSIVVTEGLSGARVGETSTNFYKITTNGSFEEIKFVNADGTDIDPSVANPTISVEQILNLNSSFLLLSGDFSVSDTLGNLQRYTSLLVRKEDGAIYDFAENDINLQQYRLGEEPIKYDGSNNIYYSNGFGVSKLTISNPDEISKVDYLSSGQRADFFDIDSNGACIYKYGQSSGVTNSNGTNDIRIKKVNGGIFEVKVNGQDNREFWLGSNGSFYFVSYTWSNGYLPTINKINIVNNDVTISPIWSDLTFTYEGVGRMFRTNSQGFHKIQKANSTVFIDTYYSSASGYSWEFFENTNTVENIVLPPIQEGSIIVNSEQYYFIATGTDLYKVNIDTHEYTKLLNSGEYEVYSMNVDNSNIVQFSGLRFSDGKKIFAEISSGGSITILDQELDKKATILERLD